MVPIIIIVVLLGTAGYFYYSNNVPNKFDASDYVEPTIPEQNPEDLETMDKLLITESELNDNFTKSVIGKGSGGYTIESINVDLQKDSALVSGKLNDGTQLNVSLSVDETGRNIVVNSVTVSDSGPFASVKEAIIKNLAETAINQKIEEYKDQFSQVVITENAIEVYF